MKIKYDMTENYKKMYDLANGIYASKKELIKNPDARIRPYLLINFYKLLAVEIMAVVAFIIGLLARDTLIAVTAIFLIAWGFLCWIIGYISFHKVSNSKLNSKKGVLVIDEEGIEDQSDTGNTFKFSYESIELVVATDDILAIISNTPIMIFVPIKDRKKVVKKISEYSDVKIIDRCC